MKLSNGISTHAVEQMCKFILKSIQNCRSYSPDKNLIFKRDLDLGPTLTNISNGTSTDDGEQSCQIILKSINNCRVMVQTNSDACTDILRTVIETTVSLIASGLDKNLRHLSYI